MVTYNSRASVHHLVLLPHVIAGQTICWAAGGSDDTGAIGPGIDTRGIRKVQTPAIVVRNTGTKAHIVVFTTRFTFATAGALAAGCVTRIA